MSRKIKALASSLSNPRRAKTAYSKAQSRATRTSRWPVRSSGTGATWCPRPLEPPATFRRAPIGARTEPAKPICSTTFKRQSGTCASFDQKTCSHYD